MVYTFCLWNITTKLNLGGVNVILQTVRQIDATQNKAVPDDPVRIGINIFSPNSLTTNLVSRASYLFDIRKAALISKR